VKEKKGKNSIIYAMSFSTVKKKENEKRRGEKGVIF